MKPLAIALLEVPPDGLDVAAIVAHGEFFTLGLEQDDLYLMARALLTYHQFQPYHSLRTGD